METALTGILSFDLSVRSPSNRYNLTVFHVLPSAWGARGSVRMTHRMTSTSTGQCQVSGGKSDICVWPSSIVAHSHTHSHCNITPTVTQISLLQSRQYHSYSHGNVTPTVTPISLIQSRQYHSYSHANITPTVTPISLLVTPISLLQSRQYHSYSHTNITHTVTPISLIQSRQYHS